MAIKYTIEKHASAFPTNMLASKGGEHIFNLLMDKNRDNGEVVALKDWEGMDYFSVKEPTGVKGTVMYQAENGDWYVLINEPGDGVFVYNVPINAEQFTKAFESEKAYFNAKDEIVRGYGMHKGDRVALSVELFAGTPADKKSVEYKNGKWTIGE